MILRLGAARAARLLIWGIAALTAGYAVTTVVYLRLGYDRQLGLRHLFDLNGEANLPAWYSSALLLTAAGLLAVTWRGTAAEARGERRAWAALAAVFVFLAADETAEIHELLNPLREQFGAEGLLYWAWVIPYGIAGLVLAIAYARFLWRLPRRTAGLFIGAAALYVGGALVLEMAGGYASATFGRGSLPVVITYTLEELGEMFGMVLFIYALLDHLARRDGRVEIALEPGGHRGAAPDAAP